MSLFTGSGDITLGTLCWWRIVVKMISTLCVSVWICDTPCVVTTFSLSLAPLSSLFTRLKYSETSNQGNQWLQTGFNNDTSQPHNYRYFGGSCIVLIDCTLKATAKYSKLFMHWCFEGKRHENKIIFKNHNFIVLLVVPCHVSISEAIIKITEFVVLGKVKLL